MLRAEYTGPALLRKSGLAAAERVLRRQISDLGAEFSMHSQSGTTATIAINIFEEIRRPYTVIAYPGVGYLVMSEPVRSASDAP